LSGFAAPDQGSIQINGQPVGSFQIPDWKKQVIYIPQNPYIFRASFRDNVAFYHPQADQAEVLSAIQTVGLEEFLDELPYGLDTQIGEGARPLSGGQAQRVALARALLDKSRRILLFDEPTAHLDIETEVELKEKIIEAAGDLNGLHEFRFVIKNPGGGSTNATFEGTLVTPGRGHPYFESPVYDPPAFDPLLLLPYLSDISHNPFEVMAYLTALYGDFTDHDIEDILRDIFETAFSLEITESFEVRTDTVEAWYYESRDLGSMQDLGGYVDGVWVEDWQWVSDWQEVRVEPFEEDMEYNWHCREVVLTINSTVGDVLLDRMDDEQQERYILIMESHGLRQFVGSPFEDNWLGFVSSIYGYRFHPVTLEREMHTGIDIAKPEGTPVMCGAKGTVTFAGDKGSYGNTVIIEYTDDKSGLGIRLSYAHLAAINVSAGDVPAAGDIIGTVGQTGTATGAHLHMEISINENGGEWKTIDPIYFTEPYPS
jgi:hypothetical protein